MTLREFHHGLRILLNLDRDVLVDAAVLQDNDLEGWQGFRGDPFRWLLFADDQTADALWELMKTRMEFPGGDR